MGDATPVWIIEVGVFGPNSERLRYAVERHCLECYAVSQHTLSSDLLGLRDGEPLATDACVIGYGSFSFAHCIQEKR